MSNREIQREKTRDSLIDAFFRLYAQKPIEKISIKEVTALAGCHRSTFYEYFTDIYDLRAYEESRIIQLEKETVINPIMNGEVNPLVTESILHPVLNLYQEKGSYILVLLGSHGDPLFQQKIKTLLLQTMKHQFRLPENDVRTDYFLEFLTSGFIAVINRMYREKNISIEELIEYLHPMVSGIIKKTDI